MLEIGGERRLEIPVLAFWSHHSYPGGMQGLPFKADAVRQLFGPAAFDKVEIPLFIRIQFIAQQRMPDCCSVDPDLVGATGNRFDVG